ncbi:MAG: SufE family protein [Myxococcales bacterium]|nr:SufE family protein [Myxococcales bacterium]
MDIEELADNLEFLDDWEERYRYLIELGHKLPELPADQHNEINKVRGCMSQVWLMPRVDDSTNPPTLHFLADSDAAIVKGLIAVLMVVYSGKTPEEILAVDINEVFGRLGLEQHITPNRRNGFFSMVGRIKDLAQASLAA